MSGGAQLIPTAPLPSFLILLLGGQVSRGLSLEQIPFIVLMAGDLMRWHLQQVATCHFGCVYWSEQIVKRSWQ